LAISTNTSHGAFHKPLQKGVLGPTIILLKSFKFITGREARLLTN
jgi:hypothetical protein